MKSRAVLSEFGEYMSAKLSNDDCCAVDLLLEHAQTPGISQCFTQETSSNVRERLSRVEKLLNMLHHFAPDEPPADLLHATLSRCDQRGTVRPPIISTPRPTASL